jgi:DNA-binding transcriptional LysR family regulator
MRGTVAQISKRGAARIESPVGTNALARGWDDLRVFLVVARAPSIRKAATALRTTSATVARTIERLEETIGSRLFNRLPGGVTLTAEGRSVYTVAEQMERSSQGLRPHVHQDPKARGIVRCSVTEGLGAFWVLPHLVQFSRAHPSTIVDLRCSMELADVLRMETDVAIQLVKPHRPHMKMARLGRLYVYPFASRRYVDTYGKPASLSEVENHRFLDLRGPQIEEGAAERVLKMSSIEGIVALRTNASIAHFHAVELGLGIGGLPTYVTALGADLIPIDIGVHYPVDIWMTYHPDVRSTRRVAVFIDSLRTLFDPKRFPWFGDQFIHPRVFAEARKAGKYTRVNLPSLMRL